MVHQNFSFVWTICFLCIAFLLIFEIFYMVLARAKVRVEKSFLTENLKMDVGQFLWLLCGYCEAM